MPWLPGRGVFYQGCRATYVPCTQVYFRHINHISFVSSSIHDTNQYTDRNKTGTNYKIYFQTDQKSSGRSQTLNSLLIRKMVLPLSGRNSRLTVIGDSTAVLYVNNTWNIWKSCRCSNYRSVADK